MSEPTHRMVNGQRVDLTPGEVAEIKAEWAKWPEKLAAKRARSAAKEVDRQALQDKLGLTDDEWSILQRKIQRAG